MSDPTQTSQPSTTQPIEASIDENKLIAERRAKLDKVRGGGIAFPNDFRRDALAVSS